MNKEEIIQALSEKYKVSKKDIEQAVNSQFKFAKENMERNDFPAIRLPFFGIFKPNYKKINKVIELKKQKEQNEQQKNS